MNSMNFLIWFKELFVKKQYCFHCKKKHVMINSVPIVLRNGSHAYRGSCSVCGTGMIKFATVSDINRS